MTSSEKSQPMNVNNSLSMFSECQMHFLGKECLRYVENSISKCFVQFSNLDLNQRKMSSGTLKLRCVDNISCICP